MSQDAKAGSSKAVLDVDELTDGQLLSKLDEQLDALPGVKRNREAMSSSSRQQGGEQATAPAAAAAASARQPTSSGKPGARGVVLNEEQEDARLVLDAGKSLNLVGKAGTGKTLVEEEFAAMTYDAEGDKAALLWCAPNNSQVQDCKRRAFKNAKLCAVTHGGKRIRTAASVFKLPLHGLANGKKMAIEMNAGFKEVCRKPNFKLIINEASGLSPHKRMAISECLQELRKDNRPDGGAQVLDAHDPGQNKPMLNKAEIENVKGMAKVGPKWELMIEAPIMQPGQRETRFLTKVQRFKEALYQDGCSAMRLGNVDKNVVKLVQVTEAREFSEAEDLAAQTIYGTTAEVMERNLEAAPRRAAQLGLTVANGGAWLFDAKAQFPERQELQDYSEGELNAVRSYGLEKQFFYKGARVLVVQKAPMADTEDDGEDED